MGSSVFAQSGISRAAGGDQADGGKCEIRFQLADRNGDRLFSGGVVVGSYFGIETEENDADFRAYAIPDEIRDHRDDVYAGAGLCDEIFRDGRGVGTRVYADRVVLSIFRDVHWLAGCGADGERHVVECIIWRLAADYGGAVELEPDFDVRVEQRGRGDGQDD